MHALNASVYSLSQSALVNQFPHQLMLILVGCPSPRLVQFQVDVTTLDTIVPTLPLLANHDIDMLKIDTEGAPVLRPL